jgi:hypothetical protein
MFILNMTFNTIEELQNFVNIRGEEKVIIKEPKIKKETDRRGQNVKELHQNAKAYQQEHPEIPYRECLKLGNIKNN